MSKILVDESDLHFLIYNLKSIINVLTEEQKELNNYEIRKIELFFVEYNEIVQLKKEVKAYYNLFEKLKYANPIESKKAYYYYKTKKIEMEKKQDELKMVKLKLLW